MKSPHHHFAHVTLRKSFFARPNEVLAELTAHQSAPLIKLWRRVCEHDQGETAWADSAQPSMLLVTLGNDSACVVVQMPEPAADQEAHYVAMVSTPDSFRYFVLERCAERGSVSDGSGHFCEWTPEGLQLSLEQAVPCVLSEFVRVVRKHA